MRCMVVNILTFSYFSKFREDLLEVFLLGSSGCYFRCDSNGVNGVEGMGVVTEVGYLVGGGC